MPRVERGERHALGACLAALYLPGGPSGIDAQLAPRSGWRQVADALLAGAPPLGGCAALLKRRGLWREASLLDAPGVLAAAEALVAGGAAATAADADWPHGFPPALWQAGRRAPLGQGAAVVGSRSPSPAARASAAQLGAAALAEGLTLVTGGAAGVDALALDACGQGWAPRAVVLHPAGLAHPDAQARVRRWPWAWHLSASAPMAPFASSAAMERNGLIYASSLAAVAVGPRWRQGGTWHGAIYALRRRLCPVAIVPGAGDAKAERALIALGAHPLSSLPSFVAQVRAGLLDAPQPSLFDAFDGVQEGAGGGRGRIYGLSGIQQRGAQARVFG